MKRFPLILPILLLAWTGSAPENRAAKMLVPVELQVNLFAKVLRFDRSLEEQQGDELVVGVLYQERVRDSDLAKDAFIEEVRKTSLTIQDRRVKTVPLAAGTPEDLARSIEEHGLDLLYVGPVRALDIGKFSRVTRSLSVITLTGVPQFVEDGLSIGIGLAQDRPEIIINVDAARLEGASFQARLLQLARIVHN